MKLPQILARIESANLAALARNAGVSYWQLYKLARNPDYDPPLSLIEGLAGYFARVDGVEK